MSAWTPPHHVRVNVRMTQAQITGLAAVVAFVDELVAAGVELPRGALDEFRADAAAGLADARAGVYVLVHAAKRLPRPPRP